MYDLSPDPSALDIIQRSMTCHPALLIEALEARAKEDLDYSVADNTSPMGRQSARASYRMAKAAIEAIQSEDLDRLQRLLGAGIIALGIACKLQCLPNHIRLSSTLKTWPTGE